MYLFNEKEILIYIVIIETLFRRLLLLYVMDDFQPAVKVHMLPVKIDAIYQTFRKCSWQ